MQRASEFGACNRSSKVSDWKSLSWMFFTPQGREFCEENNFPTHAMFRQMKDDVAQYGVFVDCGDIQIKNSGKVALIGETSAELTYSGANEVHKVILMHGAKARIAASSGAVILLVNIGKCEVEIVKDETVIIL